jgi:hypothetical protein
MTLDWNRLLGFEQIADRRAAVTASTADSRIGNKVGDKRGLGVGRIGNKVGGKGGGVFVGRIGSKVGGKGIPAITR